jgi:hypothetical protein
MPSTNLKHHNYLIIIIFHGNYLPIASLLSYSNSKYKKYFHYKKTKEPNKETTSIKKELFSLPS